MSLTSGLTPFVSGPPRVRLVNAFARPFENALATARTCYSSKVVTEADVSGDHEPDAGRRAAMAQRRDDLARSIYQAGHHTTLQHAHFQFALDNVSRHFIWSFLHAHPFYNSEQVSQRYVEVRPGAVAVPPLAGEALAMYQAAVDRQMADYKALIQALDAPCAAEYFRLFPARRKHAKYARDVKKKAQEIARYVLPVGTTAHLYHTVSGLTLMRYWRVARAMETSLETQWVAGLMVEQMLAVDPLFEAIIEEPVALEQTPEWEALAGFEPATDGAARFRAHFDRELEGRVSRLIDWKAGNERVVAQSVREVLALSADAMPDAEALALALDPSRNRLLGEAMNVSTLSKLGRCLFHASYTFSKKLSHAADSQDQRHRMTPASRPLVALHLDDVPDHVVPGLIASDEALLRMFAESMQRSWEAFAKLRRRGVCADLAAYVLPNALAVRFTESADLLNLHHKLKSRLCYNAQEEIWRASHDEALQVAKVNPTIGKYLLPPCGLRALARVAPICPEGDRYCGVPVWRLPIEDYRRLI